MDWLMAKSTGYHGFYIINHSNDTIITITITSTSTVD